MKKLDLRHIERIMNNCHKQRAAFIGDSIKNLLLLPIRLARKPAPRPAITPR